MAASTMTIASDFSEQSSIHLSKLTTIKSLSESGLTSIPSSFASKDLHDLPVLDSSQDTIPIIDFSLLTSSDPQQRCKIIQDLGKACEEWGFFMLINHGMPESLINSMMEGVKGFFNLSDEEKREFQGKHFLDPMRCGSSFNTAVEKVHCWRDFLKVFVHPEFHFPHKPSGFSDTALEYFKKIREIIRELLKGVSESLGLEPNYISKAVNHESSFQVFIANLYPPCPQPELAVGIHPHSDHGLLTVVSENGISGLQTLHNGMWVKVKAPPNALMVNTADLLEVVSNGKYKSNVHRAALYSNATRITMVTANGPSLDQVISPAPDLVNESHRPAYTSITYSDGEDAPNRTKGQTAPMASRSLFLTLRRRWRNTGFINSDSQSPSLLSRANLSRFLSSGALGSDFVEETPNSLDGDDLRSRLFRLRLPKRSATNVLQKWVSEGNHITVSELRDISRELRKSQHYKHALEISEWMVTHEEYELSDSDYAVRIDLMTKVFGIDAAERYFEGLPLSAKTSETYTALLHSYAGAKFTEKAEELYQNIKNLNLSFSALPYNEMMTLYMSVGQVEKVPLVVEELKQQKVAPDIFTYNLWISACAATLNIDEVRRILDEMSRDEIL